MKSDLDLLIAILEDDKASLELAINDGLTEHDYKSVYQNGTALNKVESQLYRLRTFKDPHYEAEERFKRFNKRFTVANDNEASDYLKSFWDEQLKEEFKKIEELRAQKILIVDGQEIDNALFCLNEGKYRRFRLNFTHRGESLQIDFHMAQDKLLHIIIKSKFVSDYDPDDPEEKQIHLFENLGFRRYDNDGVMIYEYNMANFKSAWDIKILLSRIVYDIGYFGQERQATIEFND